MSLPPESIKEFQAAYRVDFGVDLSEKEAKEMAGNLFSFYQLIIPKNEKNHL